MTTNANVHTYADQLRQYATHFVMEDWCYTRDHDIHRILYKNRPRATRSGKTYRWDPSRLPYRIQSALSGLREDLWAWLTRNPDELTVLLMHGRTHPWRMFKARLRSNNPPDGHLDGGNVIVHWEETGEYLQYVQPSVGALLADLMDAHPDLPAVQAVANEMKRINDDYGRRIRKESR